MTMLRFEQEKRVGFREYMRSDGTRSYFFCLDTVRDLFAGVGFIEVLVSLLLGCCKLLLHSRFLWCMSSLSISLHGCYQVSGTEIIIWYLIDMES